MPEIKKVKDVMMGIFDYPHLPYWFSIKQAIGMVNVSLASTGKQPEPLAVLVFDEKYNLLGTLGLRDIIRGLEPKFLKPAASAQVHEEDESGLSLLWDTLFDEESGKMAERPVGDVMVPAKYHVKPDDPVTKAAYLMIHHDLVLLPVLEDDKKFAGLIRIAEIFNEMSKAILK